MEREKERYAKEIKKRMRNRGEENKKKYKSTNRARNIKPEIIK